MVYKQVVLGDYFKFEKGLGYKGEFLVEESEVGLIGIDSQIPGGGYKSDSEKPYSGTFKPEHVVDSGDVIVATTDITQDGSVLGSTLMVPDNVAFQTLIYSGDVMKAVPLNPDEFSLEYLYNLYRVEKFRKILAYGDSGTTVRRIGTENLAEQVVSLPDLPIQIAINEIISLFDQQIENNKSLSKNLEMLAQSVFKSWFVDFDPVHSKTRGDKPIGMDDETAALFPDSFEESEMGLIPSGWKIGKYENLGVIRQGKYLGPKDIISECEDGYFPVEGATKTIGFSRKVAISKDLPAISCRGNCGVVRLVQAPAWISNNLMTINSPESHENFNYFLMLSDKFDDVISGSVQGQITISSLSAKQCLLPDKRLISRFCEAAEPFMKQIGLLKSQNKTLTEIRDALLPRLISGELEIPEELL